MTIAVDLGRKATKTNKYGAACMKWYLLSLILQYVYAILSHIICHAFLSSNNLEPILVTSMKFLFGEKRKLSSLKCMSKIYAT